MAAPTNAAKRQERPCQPGAVHTWHLASVIAVQRHVRSWMQNRSDRHIAKVTRLTQRAFLRRTAKGLQPGSLSQKKIDLLEKPTSGGFVLQKEVIPSRKRYETSTGNPG